MMAASREPRLLIWRGQSIRALEQARSNPKIMVAGTLKGVYQSDDSGVHWKQISPAGSGEIHEVESIAIDPVDPKIIYAGTWHLPWKTTDGGANWRNITKEQGIIDDSDVFSIIIDPKQPSVVYLSACSGIYKSETGGEVFRKQQGIPNTATAHSRADAGPGERGHSLTRARPRVFIRRQMPGRAGSGLRVPT